MRRLAWAPTVAAVVLLAGCAPTGGGASAEATDAAEVITVGVGETDAGPSLVGPDGRTLYVFTQDTDGSSTCYDDCAAAWPPLEVPDGASVEPGEGVTGELGITERDDGASQVTYDGMPLYSFASDAEPGDAAGHGVNDVWFIASPEGQSGAEPSESAEASESAEPSDHDGHEPSPTSDDDYGY
jgi:predicted lipoprotein with Yx(FWY)xxD motif